MSVEIVLTVIAKDRPGIVQTIAETVAAHGGNWIESSMSRLAGEFAGIVLVDVPEQQVGGLEGALAELDRDGISIAARRTAEPAVAVGQEAVLELTGSDHPGIVRDISAVLAKHGASIDDLETNLFPGSMSGEALFSARARIVLPAGLSAEDLRNALEELAQDIMVEIELKAAE